MGSQKSQTQLIMHTHTRAHTHTRSSLLTSSLDSAVLHVLLTCCGVYTIWLTWEGLTQQHLFKRVHQLSVPLSWPLFNVFPIVNKWLGESSRAAHMTKIIYLNKIPLFSQTIYWIMFCTVNPAQDSETHIQVSVSSLGSFGSLFQGNLP